MSTTVAGIGRTLAGTLTRPANTTAYAAGQVIGDPTAAVGYIAIPNAGVDAQNFSIIQHMELIDSANVSPKADLEAWIFSAPPTNQADQAAFNPSNADMANLISVVAFPLTGYNVGGPGAGAAGNAVNVQKNLGIPFNSSPSSNQQQVPQAIYIVLVVRNAYAPVSGEQFTVKVGILN